MNVPRILPDLSARPVWSPAPRDVVRRGRRQTFTSDQVSDCFTRGLSIEETMAELGCSRTTVAKLKKAAGLTGRARPSNRASAGRITRHKPHDLLGRPASMPPIDHPAFNEAHTLFPGTVVAPSDAPRLLIDGFNSRKIGGAITKGRWKGFPVFTLTLEERATCPTTCQLWRSCYGNQMHLARRHEHGSELEKRIAEEIATLSAKYPRGFAVRLHVLGDFYSVQYVERWRTLLDGYPALHVFGFSARWNTSDPIAAALVRLTLDRWDRFAIRFSNAPVDECSTVTIEHPLQKPADAVICPQQLGKTATCGTCGLCWATTKRVAFLRH